MKSSRFIRKVSALLIFVALISGFALLAFVPHIVEHKITTEIQEKSSYLNQLKQQILSEKQLRIEQQKIADLDSNSNIFLDGDSVGIAGANLQKILIDRIDSNGGKARTLQIRPPISAEQLTKISVDVTLSIDNNGLKNFVYGLETGLPVLFLDNLQIRPQRVSRRNKNDKQPKQLNVTILVSGYLSPKGTT